MGTDNGFFQRYKKGAKTICLAGEAVQSGFMDAMDIVKDSFLPPPQKDQEQQVEVEAPKRVAPTRCSLSSKERRDGPSRRMTSIRALRDAFKVRRRQTMRPPVAALSGRLP